MEKFGIFNYWIYIVLMMIGFYGVIARENIVKKIISLGLFQTGIFLFFISMAYVEGGAAPILEEGIERYANPLPHVLILTAIVVSISVSAVALAVTIQIKRAYGTVEVDEIEELEDHR